MTWRHFEAPPSQAVPRPGRTVFGDYWYHPQAGATITQRLLEPAAEGDGHEPPPVRRRFTWSMPGYGGCAATLADAQAKVERITELLAEARKVADS